MTDYWYCETHIINFRSTGTQGTYVGISKLRMYMHAITHSCLFFLVMYSKVCVATCLAHIDIACSTQTLHPPLHPSSSHPHMPFLNK